MLNHKLGPGIAVLKEYSADLPQIEAYAGELNQVWTNLIDNAVDAMDGSGMLRVTARAVQNGVVVEVADTGPGIPPEVAEHAFEPFFTTKEMRNGHRVPLNEFLRTDLRQEQRGDRGASARLV